MSFFSELKRRNVIRVASAYVVAAWLIVQVVETIFPVYGLPDSAIRLVITLLAIGFVPTLVLAWVFELTPEGIRRESEIDPDQPAVGESWLNRAILVMLALALGYFAFDKFVLDPAEDARIAEAALEEGRAEVVSSYYGPRSIAVLPFRNLSGDPGQDYFGDGIAIEFITFLTGASPQLRVTPYRSSFHVDKQELGIPAMGEALNVDHVLEGSFRLDGELLRVTVTLTDAQADSVMWSDTYDWNWADSAAIQRQVAETVVRRLRVELPDGIPLARQPDAGANRLYLQALHLLKDWELEGLENAASLLEQAVAIDSGFTWAWVRLGDVSGYLWARCVNPEHDHYPVWRESLVNAILIDPEHAEALSLYAAQQFIDAEGRVSWDWPSLTQRLGKALAQEPANPFVLGKTAGVLWHLGRLEEAIAVFEYLVKVDPGNAVLLSDLGWLYLGVGRVDEAMQWFETSLLMSPDTMEAAPGVFEAWLYRGEAKKALEFNPDPGPVHEAMAWHAMGEHERSDAALGRLIAYAEHIESADLSGQADAIRKFRGGIQFAIARVLAFRGERDRAFSWLEKALAHDYLELLLIMGDNSFKSLHGDPRWLGIRERTGRSPLQLEAIRFQVELPE